MARIRHSQARCLRLDSKQDMPKSLLVEQTVICSTGLSYNDPKLPNDQDKNNGDWYLAMVLRRDLYGFLALPLL
jgi:hypothetical protein